MGVNRSASVIMSLLVEEGVNFPPPINSMLWWKSVYLFFGAVFCFIAIIFLLT
jgi:hypothetical protein